MKQRCLDPNFHEFHYYGGRGVAVCPRWMEFVNFLADMGERPEGLTLDRIDNDGPYSPENCRWSSRLEQQQNTRQTRRLMAAGKTQSLSAWARELGMKRESLVERLRRGWPVEVALTTPPLRRANSLALRNGVT